MPTTPPVTDESAEDHQAYELQLSTTNKASKYPGMGVLKKVPVSRGRQSRTGPSHPISPDEVARDGDTPSSAALDARSRTASPEQGGPCDDRAEGQVAFSRAGSPSFESSTSMDLGSGGVQLSNVAHDAQDPSTPSVHTERGAGDGSETASLMQGSTSGLDATMVEERTEDSAQQSPQVQTDEPMSTSWLESLWRVLNRMKAALSPK